VRRAIAGRPRIAGRALAVAAGLLTVAACSSGGETTATPTTGATGTSTSEPAATTPDNTGSTSGATDDTDGSSAPVPSTPEANELSASDAAALIAGYDPAAEDSDAIIIHRGEATVIAAAGDVLASGGTPGQEWAAVYIWANEGDGSAPLLPYLDATDAAIRAMAATGVLARGEREGFAPLIALLEDTSVLAGSEPPMQAWSFAATMLASLTGVSENGPPFDADDAQRAAGKQAWATWVADHSATLHFDEAEGRWLV
jgi:hypothetical protein